jgi:hypothetical protein
MVTSNTQRLFGGCVAMRAKFGRNECAQEFPV